MEREQYISDLNSNHILLGAYYRFYELGKGTIELPVFGQLFPQWYKYQNPFIQQTINNRVIAVLDNHFKVNLVIKDGNLVKRY